MLAAAADEGAAALLGALEAEAQGIWTAPHRRRGEVLGPEDRADARVAADLRSAAGELRGLRAAEEALLGTPQDVLDALGAASVREPLGADAAAGRAPRARPLEIRARRFRAVFVCGLQDGEFPGRPKPDPFLSDDDRRALGPAGLRLPLHEDVLDRERSLFYSAVSRPEDMLFLSWRSSDEEGEPLRRRRSSTTSAPCSPRICGPARHPPARRRDVGAADAPTPHELRRAYAAAAERPEPAPLGAPPPRRRSACWPAARRSLPAGWRRSPHAARVAGRAAAAPGPHRARPGAAAARLAGARGPGATLELLRERTGSARLAPERLDAALGCLADALAERARGGPAARSRALLRGLEADLERYLRTEAECGAAFEPSMLEWSFGREQDAHGPLPLGDGAGAVSGRVDRVDVGPDGAAIVRDYKRRVVVGGTKWGTSGSCRSRSTCWPCASCSASSRWPGSTSR